MQNDFGGKIRQLRENHFPGMSLRNVGEKIRPKSNYFTYLSRVEAGIIKPSRKFLAQIREEYKLSEEEYKELVLSYATTEIMDGWAEFSDAEKNDLAGRLFRKIKNKSEKEDEN